MLTNIVFENTLWLLGIPLSIGVLVVIHYFQKQEFAKALQLPQLQSNAYWFPRLGMLSTLHHNKNMQAKGYGRLMLLCTMMSGFLVALAQPTLPGEKFPIKIKQREFVFVIDTSISMLQKDYSVNGKPLDRMSFVKSLIDKILLTFPGDRFALVVYGEHAAVLAPFTEDQHFLRSQLARVETELAGRINNMSAGLSVALKLFIEKKVTTNTNLKPSIVLFSHGARPIGEPHPLQLMPLFQQLKLRLFTIGIGSTQALSNDTNLRGLEFDPVNIDLLTQLAKQTQGVFYWANNPQATNKLIDTMQRESVLHEEVRYETQTTALYIWPLGISVLLLLLWQSSFIVSRSQPEGRTQ